MRKVSNITITESTRDKGKVFQLTEMPATRGEAWATRALLALMKGGVDLPENFSDMPMAAMAEVGFKALSGIDYKVVEPLLLEMMECVKIIPDPSKPNVVRPLIEEDIEEIATIVKLRAEVWKLHTDFFQAANQSNTATSR